MALATFKDCAALLAATIKDATGQEVATALDTSTFIAQATTALEIGVDPIMKSLSQMVARTVFAQRAYTGKFKGIMKDSLIWGNHVRKINYIDDDPEKDERGMSDTSTLVAGNDLSPWKWDPANVLQTNFYGAQVYQRSIMLTRDQIYSAFSGPEEFGSFVSGLMTRLNNQIEQDKEAMARLCVDNFIAGKIKGDATNVIHLLTEYKAETGQTALTKADLMKPENFQAFTGWLVGRLNDLSNLMEERSLNYHVNITDKPVMRHTPKADQRLLVYSPILTKINSIARANTFNKDLLSMDVTEAVNFWQKIDDPDSINIKPNYLAADGTITVADAAVAQTDVLGVLFDTEAMGATVFGEWSGTTPLDPRHGITNIYNHYTVRYWNDFTENGVVLLLD